MHGRFFVSPRVLIMMMVMAVFLVVSPRVSLGNASNEINQLQDQIEQTESRMDSLDSQVDAYRQKVQESAAKSASLVNDVELIENQAALTELDIVVTQVEIEHQELQIDLLTEKISALSLELEQQQKIMAELMFTLYRKDRMGLVEVLFGSNTFDGFFNQVEELESVNSDLSNTVERTRVTRMSLADDRAEQEVRLGDLVDLEGELESQLAILDSQLEAKETLLVETQSSEAQYRVLMSELRQERQAITSALASLQAEVEEKIRQADMFEDAAVISMPVHDYVLTAYYHDPTYPFRHLFEHSGIDLAAWRGTPVYAAAPGVVAWARTGRSYGNYVMIIHSGGLATLYAHLDAMYVVSDQFVSRGEQIGAVGSTGFSTGPHLHFEVRLNGIPVDPYAYLID